MSEEKENKVTIDDVHGVLNFTSTFKVPLPEEDVTFLNNLIKSNITTLSVDELSRFKKITLKMLTGDSKVFKAIREDGVLKSAIDNAETILKEEFGE